MKEVADTFADHAAPLDVAGCIGARIHQSLRHATPTWSVLAPAPPDASDGTLAGPPALTRQSVDTVLELGPLTLEVSGPFGAHPDGAMILTVPVRLARSATGTELLAHEFRWTQGAGPVAWPIDAQAFGEAIGRACADLALDVVRAVAGHVVSITSTFDPSDGLGVAPRE